MPALPLTVRSTHEFRRTLAPLSCFSSGTAMRKVTDPILYSHIYNMYRHVCKCTERGKWESVLHISTGRITVARGPWDPSIMCTAHIGSIGFVGKVCVTSESPAHRFSSKLLWFLCWCCDFTISLHWPFLNLNVFEIIGNFISSR